MPLETSLEVLSPSHLGGHQTQEERPLPVVARPVRREEPSYYGIPILQRPVWSWEIGCYFFLGGLSAGAYLMARLAERFGGERFREVTRTGTAVALAAVAPCPPLLIADLGDPSRFHHMLRVFKPRSPMNFGAWVLTAYSGTLTVAAAHTWLRLPRRLDRLLTATADAAGVPLALLFSGYTGVLLSATATPVWTKNRWLGALFCASGISNGIAAMSLALALRGSDPESPAEEALEKIDTAAHVAEAAMLTAYVVSAGELARPLTHGRYAPLFWGAAAGIVVGEVARRMPVSPGKRRWVKTLAAGIGIAGGFTLKWAIFRAGIPSAQDPDANRRASRLPRAP